MRSVFNPVLAALILVPAMGCSGGEESTEETSSQVAATDSPTATATRAPTPTATRAPTPTATRAPTPTDEPRRPGGGGGPGGGDRTPPSDPPTLPENPRTPPPDFTPPDGVPTLPPDRTPRPGPGETPFPTAVPTPRPTEVPIGVGDLCTDPLIASPGTYQGTLEGARNDYDPECAPNGAPGPDVVYRVAVESGKKLRVRLVPFTETLDPVMYIAPNCQTIDRTCTSGVDDRGPGLVEDLVFVAGQAENPQIVMDSRTGAGDYRIEISIGDTVLKITDVQLTESRRSDGNGDTLQDPGETWTASLTFFNDGDVDIRAIRVDASSLDAGTEVEPVFPPLDLNIPAGGNGDVDITYLVTDAPTEYTARIGLHLSNNNNDIYESFLVFRNLPTEETPTQPPATEVPATDPPATDIPETDPPATEVPATDPPATDVPATATPGTDTPATDTPTTTPSETPGEPTVAK